MITARRSALLAVLAALALTMAAGTPGAQVPKGQWKAVVRIVPNPLPVGRCAMITVELQDLYGNPVPAPTGGAEVALASDSAGTAVFATTVAGTSVASILIPAGQSSATIFYGDTAPGRPVITASWLLISAKQTETIATAP